MKVSLFGYLGLAWRRPCFQMRGWPMCRWKWNLRTWRRPPLMSPYPSQSERVASLFVFKLLPPTLFLYPFLSQCFPEVRVMSRGCLYNGSSGIQLTHVQLFLLRTSDRLHPQPGGSRRNHEDLQEPCGQCSVLVCLHSAISKYPTVVFEPTLL